jgi:hypothetical protein
MNRRILFLLERGDGPLAAEIDHYVSQRAHSCLNRRENFRRCEIFTTSIST